MKRLEFADLTMPIGLIVGLSLFTFNVIGFDFAYFPGDLGDGRLVLYFLEHAHKFFLGETESFWNAPFMFPEKNVIAYSENLLGSAPIYSLFRVFGFDLCTSYQLWYIAVTSLNFIAAFYFLKYVFKNSSAALLGAFVFAFSLALQSQLTHAQTFPRFAIPLAFLMAVKFSEDLQPKYFLYSLLFLVYQFFCGLYLGLMLAVPLGIFLLSSLVNGLYFQNTPVYTLRWIVKMVIFGLISLGVLLPLMLPYLEKKIDMGMEHYAQIISTVPTPTSYLFSQEGSLGWDFLSKMGYEYTAWWDHQIFTGGVATISFCVFGLWFVRLIRKKRLKIGSFSSVTLLAITGFITFFLFLRFGNISAYQGLFYLPGFSSMRSLTRIINIQLLFFAVATAFAFAQLTKRKVYSNPLIVVAALSILVFDNYFKGSKSYRTEVSIANKRSKNLEPAYAQIPSGSVVSYEPERLESSSILYQIDGMLLAQQYDLASINAYTGTSPAGYAKYWNEPDRENRNFWLQQNTIDDDTLYIVKNPTTVEKELFDDIPKFDAKKLREIRVESIIHTIKNDVDWLESVRKKAAENQVSLDTMLVRDANWMIDNE